MRSGPNSLIHDADHDCAIARVSTQLRCDSQRPLLELVILALLSHSLVDFSSPAAGNEGLLQYTLVAALARRGHLGIHARAYRRANNPSFALFRSRAGLREADSLSDATSSVGSLRESFESAAAFLLQLQRLLRRLAACWQRRARQTGLRLRGLSHPKYSSMDAVPAATHCATPD